MKIKKIILFCFMLILVGCQNKLENKNFDFAVVDEERVYSFSEKKERLELVERVKRNDGDQNLVDYYIEEDEQYVYALTQPMSPYRDTYLVKINKDDFSVKKEKFNLGSTLSLDSDFIYLTSISADKEEIFKYDKNTLEKVGQKSISDENVNIIRDIVSVNDKKYVLVGTVNRENFSKGTYLWKMDNDLNITDKIDLNYSLGGYLRMVLVGDDLYMIEGTNGVTSAGEPGPGKNVIKYNLETKKIQKLPLSTSYPYNLHYDRNNNNLVIQHYGVYEKTFPFTIYSLDTKEERVISFSEYKDQGSNISSFYCGKDYYYFLLGNINKVVKYNVKSDEIKEYDLGEFSLKNPHLVVGK